MKRAAPQPFPWAQAMAFGFGILRLSPAAFWSMTPRELAAAFQARNPTQPGATDHDALGALMRAYPDEDIRHE